MLVQPVASEASTTWPQERGAKMDPIEERLRKTILDHRLETPEQRRRLYEAFAARLAEASLDPEGRRDDAKFRQWSAGLDAARAAIEADHIPLPDFLPSAPEEAATLFGRVVERARRYWPTLTSISGALAAVAEFLKPLGEFTGVLLGLGVASALAGLVARRIRVVREFGEAVVASGVFVSLAAATMLSVRAFVPEAEARTEGALVVVPGVQQLQSSLLHIGARVDEIAADSRRTADTTERVAADTGRIARSVEVAKREVSEDPAKELANLGITPLGWSQAWIESSKRDDARILGLLDKAGFKPDRATLSKSGAKENASMLAQANVRAALRGMPDRVRETFCAPQFTVDPADPFEPSKEVEEALGFLRGVGIDEYRFYCGDVSRLLQALKTLRRDRWLAQCRMSVEAITRQMIPNYRCDFEGRNGKAAPYVSGVQPEFDPEIAYLASLAR